MSFVRIILFFRATLKHAHIYIPPSSLSEKPTQDPYNINKVFNDKLLILDDGKRHNVAGSTVINYIPATPVIVRRGVLSDVAINDLMEI